jgi:hypothetical protein
MRAVVAAGLVDLNTFLKQATIRRDIVVQLIRMHRDGGHPDYQRGTMEEVELKARQLAADVGEDRGAPLSPVCRGVLKEPFHVTPYEM